MSDSPRQDISDLFRAMRGRTDDDWLRILAILGRRPELSCCKTARGRTLLHVALRRGAKDIFQVLRDHGAEHDIFTACASDDCDVVDHLLTETPGIVWARDADQNTPLHWAASAEFATTPAKDDYNTTSLLISLLIDRGAAIDAINRHGETPIHWAVIRGNEDRASALAEHGAQLDIFGAVSFSELDLIEALLVHNPELVHARDRWHSWTPLHVAVFRSNPEIVDCLVYRGADVNARLTHGATPLHLAVSHSRPEMVQVLLRHGADINAADEHGRTALSRAVCQGLPMLVTLLLQHGAAHGRGLGGATERK